MLQILGQVPNDPAAVNAFVRASRMLIDRWDARDNLHAETAVEERLQQFVMRTTPTSALQVLGPVLDAIDRYPREIHYIVQGLTSTEDSNPNTAQYWYLWGLFADAVRRAKWVARLDDEHPIGREMISAIFLTSWWKDDVKHWRSLEGYADQVHALFEALPPSSIVLDDYVRFPLSHWRAVASGGLRPCRELPQTWRCPGNAREAQHGLSARSPVATACIRKAPRTEARHRCPASGPRPARHSS